ncbi:MAG: polysaccharide biosynthesis protein [Clostridia bacterium]|nr:polysaccharide biosynthesis protein [Clostridia bacterium]
MKQLTKTTGEKDRRQFLTGVLFLGGANILVKIIGLLFKIPMSYYLGDEGMGYFNSAYQIYTWLYMFSTAGLPVAVSILVAEARTRGEVASVRRIERLTVSAFLLLGLSSTALMFFGARPLALMIGTQDARYCIAAIAPTMLFICLSSAMRGYFQGFSEMAPSAVSQVLEALGKLLVGVALAAYAIRRGYALPLVAAYAVAGLAVGEAAGMLYLLLARYLYQKRGRLAVLSPLAGEVAHTSGRTLLSRLLRIALPITLSSLVMGLTGMIDLVIVQRRLQGIGYLPTEATAFYGNYTTLVVPMFNLPPALIYPIATAAVPLLSATLAAGNQHGAKRLMGSVLRVTSLIAMPCALGMAVFSRPILRLFFREDMADTAAPLLSVLAIGTLFLSLLTVSNAILQASGLASRPIFSMLVGGGVKLATSYFLIGTPVVGTLGVPLGTVLCYLAAMLCNLWVLLRRLSFVPSLSFTFFRPFAAACLSVGAALGFYLALGGDGGGRLLILAAIALAALVYVAAVFLTRSVTEEDVLLLPGGKKLAQILYRQKQTA